MPNFRMRLSAGEKAMAASQAKAWRAARKMSMEIAVRELEIVFCSLDYDKESRAKLKKGIKERIKWLQDPLRLENPDDFTGF